MIAALRARAACAKNVSKMSTWLRSILTKSCSVCLGGLCNANCAGTVDGQLQTSSWILSASATILGRSTFQYRAGPMASFDMKTCSASHDKRSDNSINGNIAAYETDSRSSALFA